MTNEVAKLNSLLKKAKNELTEDEVIALFDLTRKRIRKIEQKAINRLSKGPKKNKLKTGDNSDNLNKSET